MGNTDNILIIDKKCIYKSKYENVKNFDVSIFQDVYYQAYKQLIDIVETQEDLINRKVKPRNFDANNIIAFVGERGSGKTSCMKNFRRSFKENEKHYLENFYKKKNNNELDNTTEEILNKRFELLSVIDPSLFSVKDSIIEIVVAQMFNRFRENKRKEDNHYLEQDMLMLFEKVYKDIRIINSNKEFIYDNNYDSLEALVSLSSAVELKEDLSKLVKKYIEYMSGSDGYLIISIDDIDMSLTIGEKMLEDIRKYLIIPKVIILIAVKIDQLKEIINQRYYCYLKENSSIYYEIDKLNKYNSKSDDQNNINSETLLENFNNSIKLKTNRYLEKIIPFNRRINVNKSDFNKFNIYYGDCDAKNIIKDEIKSNSENVELYVKHLCEQYNIELNCKEYHENLRSFVSFIVLLNGFKENEDNQTILNAFFKDINNGYNKNSSNSTT